MAVATSVLAIIIDMLPAALSGNATQTAADAMINATIPSPGH
jgi:LDH2 family malate/lactate/ureidoglycolate dehydrogenase